MSKRYTAHWAARLALAFAISSVSAAALAQTAPSGFTIENAFPTATFVLPTKLEFLPDGRTLVAEKGGKIWVVLANGTKLATPFIDLESRVLSNGDRGLTGMALDPDFASNRWVYLAYTVDPDSDGVDDNAAAFGRVERYQASAGNPNVLDLASRQVLIGASWSTGIPKPNIRGHMIGTLRFGADKTLLVGSGDGGNADNVDPGGTDPPTAYGPGRTDPSENIGSFRARTINSLCGKILRLDKETGNGLASNPYWDGDPKSDRSRVWVYGLRNPYDFAVRPGTGAANPALGQPGVLYIGDVGWTHTEELDVATQGGQNFGWPCLEGPFTEPQHNAVTATAYPNPNVLCPAGTNSENPAPNTAPVLYWDHTNGAGSNPSTWVGSCAIGGRFYTGTSYPAAYRNAYFVADYSAQWIRRVQVDANDHVTGTSTFVDAAGAAVDLAADPVSGDLFYVDILNGIVRRIRYSAGNAPPTVVATLNPQYGLSPLAVTAAGSGSYDPEGGALTFAWDFGDGGTAHRADTSYTYTSNGSYNAVLTVTDDHGATAVATFPVVVGQLPPGGHIRSPQPDVFFAPNELVQLTADAADTTQGPATYRWDVDLYHNTHVHPGTETRLGRTASFVANTPDDGETYHLGVRLTVTQGSLTTRDTVMIWPRIDLAPAPIVFVPPVPLPGTTFLATIRVNSIDSVGTPPTGYLLREGSHVLATGSLPPIPHGNHSDVSVSIGPLSQGPHTLEFVADPDGVLHETSETDNVSSGVVSVPGLVAAYSFDSGAGTILPDLSGHGIDGTITGATWADPGRFGKALSFGASGAQVDLGNPTQLQLTGSMTVEAWVRATTNPPDDGQIVAKSDDNSGWQFKTTPDTGPQTFGFAVSDGLRSRVQRYSSTVRALNTWYHVAGVYDATARTLHTYVNGALDDGTLIGVVPAANINSREPVVIGRRVGGYEFRGAIDEVRIYDYACSQAQIQADMNTPVANQVSVPDVPTASASGGALGPAQPNPFRDRASIGYTIPRAGHVRVRLYGIGGNLVATIADGVQSAGTHSISFASRDLPTGLYLVHLEGEGFQQSRKVLHLR